MRFLNGRQAALDAFRHRRSAQTDPARREVVERLLQDVRTRGDAAVFDATERFERARLTAIELPADERRALAAAVAPDLAAAIDRSIARVRAFHEHQPREGFLTVTPEGVLGQLMRPLDRVACYVPSGKATLASSLVMTAVPAQVAGVPDVVVATPPRSDGSVDPAVAYVAEALGLGAVYRMGGAQAIGALAYGTESVPRVDKIVGPGSAWVVIAKALVFGEVGIESLPGPTETLVVADAGADPEHVAADLLAQAEHDDAVPVLVTCERSLWPRVEAALERRLADLPTATTARASLTERGTVVFVEDVAEAIDVANAFASEHLCLLVDDPWAWVGHVRHAGGLFVGASSLEALGDYVAGPSHVMPTGGTARFASAVNVRDFQKVIPVVGLTAAGTRAIGPDAVRFARAEGLEAHAQAVEARLEEA
ncbi:MAG: histidinol dehydrogenase [Trueperaceae bacterium]|nr:histidinol dehydrogenase [Trueperaceae bacterium]